MLFLLSAMLMQYISRFMDTCTPTVSHLFNQRELRDRDDHANGDTRVLDMLSAVGMMMVKKMMLLLLLVLLSLRRLKEMWMVWMWMVHWADDV